MMEASNPATQPPSGPEPSGDLARLTAAMCDGTATHADRDQLERLLANPLARKEYVATLRVHAELAWRWRKAPRQIAPRPRPKPVRPPRRVPENGGLPEPPTVRAPRWRVIAGTTLAACIVIAALVVIQAIDQGWWGQPAGGLARVVAIDGAAWQPDAAVYAIDDAVAAGEMLSLTSGLVEISYADGTAVVLEGPVSFEVRTATDGRLISGRITATLGDSSTGFAVHTPSAVITDLGTQFGVEVDATGRTDVRVFGQCRPHHAHRRARPEEIRTLRAEAGSSAAQATRLPVERRDRGHGACRPIHWLGATGRYDTRKPRRHG
jgi:hypothetical protein